MGIPCRLLVGGGMKLSRLLYAANTRPASVYVRLASKDVRLERGTDVLVDQVSFEIAA